MVVYVTPLLPDDFIKTPYVAFPWDPENEDGIMILVSAVVIQIIVLSSTLYFLWSGFFSYLWNVVQKSMYGTGSTRNDPGDNDVQHERARVQEIKDNMSTYEWNL